MMAENFPQINNRHQTTDLGSSDNTNKQDEYQKNKNRKQNKTKQKNNT